METIGKESLKSFDRHGSIINRSSFQIRKGTACKVGNYLELATKIAELQFENPQFVLFYRGQAREYMRKNSRSVAYTSLAPSIFRGKKIGLPTKSELSQKFIQLERAEQLLVPEYEKAKFDGLKKLERQQILRWSILQHYEVCDTPLLDVTHSLRIAASFASHEADAEAFIYVLGVPNLSGAITASAEAGIQIVRLASVSPPSALRPHIQEGYMLGEYPEMWGYDQKSLYLHVEVDFGRRLLAKLSFDPKEFWKNSKDFPKIPKTALYPDRGDPLFDVAKSVKDKLKRPTQLPRIAAFNKAKLQSIKK